MSEDLRQVERTYELVDPITGRIYEEACFAIGVTPADVREDPKEAVEEARPSIGDMQRFCEIVLTDMDVDLADLPLQEGRAFFTTFYTRFCRASNGLAPALIGVLNASVHGPEWPIFASRDRGLA